MRHFSKGITLVALGLCLCLQGLARTAGAQNHALAFNGMSDYIALTTTTVTNMTGPYTLEAWTYPTTSSLPHRILSNFQQLPSRGWGFGIRNTNWRHTTFGVKDYDTAANTMTTGTWTHLAVVLDGSHTASFYRNGALLASVTHTAGGRESTHTLNIGRNPTGTEYWEGYLDEIRVWNTARTPQQIADHYNRKVTGSESGLVAYYPFDEGSGAVTEDKTSGTGDGEIFGATWVAGPSLLNPLTRADDDWLGVP